MNRRIDARQGLAAGAAVVTVLLTAAAFWLSYEHLHDVASSNGLGGDAARAWAWPATVDLFIVAGELLILRASLRHTVDPWAVALAATGSLGSIALNVAGVGMHAPVLQYVVAAVPPVAALLAFGALMRQVHEALQPHAVPDVPATRHAVAVERADAPATATLTHQQVHPELPPTAPEPRPAPAALPTAVLAAEPRTRTQVRAEYVPDPDPTPVPAPDTDAPDDELTTAARTYYRDLLANGRTPSIRTLRDMYSVGQQRATRIQTELRKDLL